MGRVTAIVIRVNKHANLCAQWGTVLSALGTMAALAIAYEAFSVQNTQLKEQIDSQAKASADERERFQRQLDVQRKHLDQFVRAFQNQQTATFYTQVYTTTRFLQDHPNLYDYFKRRPASKLTAKEHSDRVKARFETASAKEQALVLIGVELLADFMDTAYAQRETLRPETGEWNTWWNYFVDCYDENPILRDFLSTNPDEYTVAEMLKPEHRDQQYVGDAHRRRPRISAGSPSISLPRL
ncbi:MAG TPA: hypothetical protein VGZ26_10715 [Pirellulales bacterium]|jgi:hypothetical protein|nr:hypothetical protein [Pirellulales bacterium]